MVTQDFRHLAQVLQSLRNVELPSGEFLRLLDRMVWAIQSSPGGSPEFDAEQHQLFFDRCQGKTPL